MEKVKPTPVHVLTDVEGRILEVVSGPNLVLPARVNSRPVRWVPVGHDPLCHKLFSEERKYLRAQIAGGRKGGGVLTITQAAERDSKGRIVAKKPDKPVRSR